MSVTEAASSHQEVPEHQVDITITSDSDSLTWQEAAKLEFTVFNESGYVGSQDELAHDYLPYNPVTSFVLDRLKGRPAGAIRIIFSNDEIGFKTINDASNGKLTINSEGQRFIIEEMDLTKTMEIGTIAIPEDLRGLIEGGLRINSNLYGAIYATAKERGVEWLIASFDQQYLERFGGIFGASITHLGPAKDYMGSPTVPVAIHVDRAIQSVADVGLQDTFDSILAVGSQLKHEH